MSTCGQKHKMEGWVPYTSIIAIAGSLGMLKESECLNELF